MGEKPRLFSCFEFFFFSFFFFTLCYSLFYFHFRFWEFETINGRVGGYARMVNLDDQSMAFAGSDWAGRNTGFQVRVTDDVSVFFFLV